MTVLSAQSILKRKIITPSNLRTVERGMTYGISGAGYDVRVSFEGLNFTAVKFFQPPLSRLNDAFGFIPTKPNGYTFMLAATMEHFNMPDDVVGIVHDKSTWARRGLAVQNTVIEPGWRGYLTLELTYHGPAEMELILQHGDPIAQIVFHQLDEPTIFPYQGKYQDQEPGPQEAR